MSAAQSFEIPRAPGSGVRPKTFAPPPPRKPRKPAKVDGLRTHLTARAVLQDRIRKPGHRAVVHVLLEDVGFRLPGGAILDRAKAVEKTGLSLRRVREICGLYPDVLRIAVRGRRLHVGSEWGLWNCRDRERERGAAWDKAIAFHRRNESYVFVEEMAEALHRARAGGPKRGLAARVPKGGFGPEYLFPVDNSEGCEDEPLSADPKVRDLALDVRPIPESYPPNSRAAGGAPTDSDLDPLRSLDRQNVKSDWDPLRSLGTRAKRPGSEPPSKAGDAAVRQEGPERISFVLEKMRATSPPPLPTDGHVPLPRATETRDQGPPRAQGSPGVRKTLHVSPGREVTFWLFLEAFERHMRRTKPLWRMVRRPECLACLRAVWENWAGGKPLRWLDPWMSVQVELFTSYERGDGYQAPGFLRHMRVAGRRVDVPARWVPAQEEPQGPEDETLEDVRAALRAEGFTPAVARGG